MLKGCYSSYWGDMLLKRNRVIIIFLLLCLFTAFFGETVSLAAETDEYGAKFLRSDDPSIMDVSIINFKAKLYEYGFYAAGVSGDTLQTMELDDLTMAAVQLVCTYNPDLIYYPDGVTNALYWRVMREDGGELKTPTDEVYQTLLPGTESEAVTKIQNRLNQLGYDEVGYSFAAGLYDDALQGAIDAFVQCNKFIYDRDEGITISLQELIFSNDAKAYDPGETSQEKFPANVISWLGANGSLLGLQIPNWSLVIIGFVMLGVIVALVFELASPNDKNNNMNKQKQIHFTIEYGGESLEHSVDMDERIRIGRAVGDFPLNLADGGVSREHCEVHMENGQLLLCDVSSYGTMVNGKKILHEQCVLRPGDVFEVGQHRITVQF